MIFATLSSNAQFFRDSITLKPHSTKDYKRFSISTKQAFTPLIPGNFYTENMGYMCKQEKYFEKFSKIPFRFRLGSVNSNDRLEGKRIPITTLP